MCKQEPNYSSMSVVLHCIIFFTFVYSKVWKTVWTPSKSFTTPFIVFLNHFQLFPSNFWAPLILFPALNPALLSVMPRQKTIKINPYNTALGATFAHVWSYQTVHICLLHDSIQGKKAILVLQPIMGHWCLRNKRDLVNYKLKISSSWGRDWNCIDRDQIIICQWAFMPMKILNIMISRK